MGRATARQAKGRTMSVCRFILKREFGFLPSLSEHGKLLNDGNDNRSDQ